MSSVHDGFEKCPFDGEPCPAAIEGEDYITGECWYDFDCRRSTYDMLHCRRHPEKAGQFLEEEEENEAQLQKAVEELSKAADWQTISDRQRTERIRAFRGFDPLPEEYWDQSSEMPF